MSLRGGLRPPSPVPRNRFDSIFYLCPPLVCPTVAPSFLSYLLLSPHVSVLTPVPQSSSSSPIFRFHSKPFLSSLSLFLVPLVCLLTAQGSSLSCAHLQVCPPFPLPGSITFLPRPRAHLLLGGVSFTFPLSDSHLPSSLASLYLLPL